MTKKIILSVILCTVCVFVMAQSQVVTHIVQRGETLESIANDYHISVIDINKANPNADGVVYVGMKLVVPVQKDVMPSEQESSQMPSEPSKGNTLSQSNHSVLFDTNPNHFTKEAKPKSQKEKLEFAAQFGFRFGSLNGDGSECYKSTFGLSVALGARYFVADQVFVEGLAGYRYLQTPLKKEYAEAALDRTAASGDLKTHSIYIPLYVGAKIEEFSIKAGPYLDYIVSGNLTLETPGKSNKEVLKKKIEKGQLSVGLNLTIMYNMYGLNFNIRLSDYANNKKCKEMAIGLIIGM